MLQALPAQCNFIIQNVDQLVIKKGIAQKIKIQIKFLLFSCILTRFLKIIGKKDESLNNFFLSQQKALTNILFRC